MRRSSRLVATAASAATAAALLVLPASPASAAVVTDYGFRTSGFGTKVNAAQNVLESGKTAFAIVACTRRAGILSPNEVVGLDAASENPAISVGAVETRSRTWRSKNRPGSTSTTNRIARVTLGTADSPQMVLEGVRTKSEAWADRTNRFKSRNTFSLVDLNISGGLPPEVLAPLNNATDDVAAQLLEAIRTAGGALIIPGLGEIRAGSSKEVVRWKTAFARAEFLTVKLYGQDQIPNTVDDSTVQIGRTRAQIFRDMTGGVMGREGVGATASVVDGVARLGRVVNQPLNCQGTNGKVRSNYTAETNIPGLAALDGVGASALGEVDDRDRTRAWTQGKVAGVTLFPGTDNAIRITAITGRATMKTRADGTVTRKDINGSSLGTLTFQGEEHSLPKPGEEMPTLPEELGALVKIEPYVTTTSNRSIQVTALRITLLDGSAANSVISLGNADTKINRA